MPIGYISQAPFSTQHLQLLLMFPWQQDPFCKSFPNMALALLRMLSSLGHCCFLIVSQLGRASWIPQACPKQMCDWCIKIERPRPAQSNQTGKILSKYKYLIILIQDKRSHSLFMLYGILIIKLMYFFKNYFPIILRKLPHIEKSGKNMQENTNTRSLHLNQCILIS